MSRAIEENKQLCIFDFGLNEKGEYVNLLEDQEKERLSKWHSYTWEQITQGHSQEEDYMIVATYYQSEYSQYGLELDDLKKEIQKIAESKCYHYGNLKKMIFVYSYQFEKDFYRIAIENQKYIVLCKHYGNIDDVLMGKEQIGYPACEIELFEKKDDEIVQIRSGYADGEHYKDDIRYKILCESFEIIKFSTNRVQPGKKPKDFCECQFKLDDFAKHWGIEDNDEVQKDE